MPTTTKAVDLQEWLRRDDLEGPNPQQGDRRDRGLGAGAPVTAGTPQLLVGA